MFASHNDLMFPFYRLSKLPKMALLGRDPADVRVQVRPTAEARGKGCDSRAASHQEAKPEATRHRCQVVAGNCLP